MVLAPASYENNGAKDDKDELEWPVRHNETQHCSKRELHEVEAEVEEVAKVRSGQIADGGTSVVDESLDIGRYHITCRINPLIKVRPGLGVDTVPVPPPTVLHRSGGVQERHLISPRQLNYNPN